MEGGGASAPLSARDLDDGPDSQPERLVRASLVCKPWRRLVTDRFFLLRYRLFHRAAL